jgi:hypothetical protein
MSPLCGPVATTAADAADATSAAARVQGRDQRRQSLRSVCACYPEKES